MISCLVNWSNIHNYTVSLSILIQWIIVREREKERGNDLSLMMRHSATWCMLMT